jgi:hypothetical protein
MASFTKKKSLPEVSVASSQKAYVIVIVASFIFWWSFLILSGSLFSGYHFTDDHEILDIYHKLTWENQGIWQEIQSRIQYDIFTLGRFRPFYFVHRVIQTKLFGINWFAWSIYTGILASFSTFLLIRFGRTIGFSWLESSAFTSIILLGNQTNIWVRLGPSETIGVFLLSIALNVIAMSAEKPRSRSLEVWSIVLIVLMSLCKESFVILIPALLCIKLWLCQRSQPLLFRQLIQNNKLALIASAIIFLLEIGFIRQVVGTDFGYAGLKINPIGVINAFLDYDKLHILLLILLSTTLVSQLIQSTKKSQIPPTYDIFYPLLIFFLIVFPQTILYAKSGIVERYLLPGILGFALLEIWLLKLIGERSRKLAHLLFVIVALILSLSLNDALKAAHYFAEDGRMTNKLLRTIETNTTTNSTILIALNPQIHYEGAFSIKRYLNYATQRDQLYVTTFGSKEADFFTNHLIDQEKAWSFLGADQIKQFYQNKTFQAIQNPDTIDCVIVFPKLQDAFQTYLAAQFPATKYSEYQSANFKTFGNAPFSVYFRKN